MEASRCEPYEYRRRQRPAPFRSGTPSACFRRQPRNWIGCSQCRASTWLVSLTCPPKTLPAIIEKLLETKELRDEEDATRGRADYWGFEADGGRPQGHGVGPGDGRQ